MSRVPSARREGLGRITGLLSVLILAGLCLTQLTPSRDARRTVAVPPPKGQLTSRVHDVFGDGIGSPTVRIGSVTVIGDATGAFLVEAIPAGVYEVEVSADGYMSKRFTYRVQEGDNSPRIKYDTGLWPNSFAIDFHAFHSRPGSPQTYGVIGIANPLDSPVYIHELFVADERGVIVFDALATVEMMQTFTLIHPNANLTLEPHPAVVLQPRSIIAQIEMPPHQSSETESPPHAFIATARYSLGRNAPPGERMEISRLAYRTLEEDYNPHSP